MFGSSGRRKKPLTNSFLIKETFSQDVVYYIYMSHLYKESRICECGYTSARRDAWSTHKKRCRIITSGDQQLISNLQKQLEAKDEQMKQQLEAKDQQMREQLQVLKEDTKQLREQLVAKDEMLNEQRDDLRMFEKLLAERFVELQDEMKQLRKRKKATRINRSEPERRKIAQRQSWMCASDACKLDGQLEAYDLDHTVPLWKGGECTVKIQRIIYRHSVLHAIG